jgi:hypothetical protein
MNLGNLCDLGGHLLFGGGKPGGEYLELGLHFRYARLGCVGGSLGVVDLVLRCLAGRELLLHTGPFGKQLL